MHINFKGIKNWYKRSEVDIATGLLIISVFGLAFSVSLFFIGFHNVDNGQNMRYLEAEFETQFVDQASDFNFYSPSQIYIIGSNQQNKAFFLTIVFSIMVGTMISFLNFKANEKRKR